MIKRLRPAPAALLIVGALTLSGCASPGNQPYASGSLSAGVPAADAPSTEAASRVVGPDQFATAVAEPGRLTINVHVPFAGSIDGTDLSVPFDRIRDEVNTLPSDRATPLAVYCRTGRMSAIAVRELVALGFTDVVELAGGMNAWVAAGRALQTEESPAAAH